MKKKRERKGQITIFIILGLVILFVFIFLFQLTTKVKKGQLAEEQEKAIGKLFEKESLRLYVQDCLIDGLEEGLLLIGRQGRIWKDQGAKEDFVPGWNGLAVGNENISYGIFFGKKGYLFPNQYPCEKEEPPGPAFCRYRYPNSSLALDYEIKFGDRGLTKEEVLEEDLERFLKAKTTQCVEKVLGQQLSSAVEINAEDLEMNLDILNEGLNIKVNYPLTLSLEGQEFFHLAAFDFFYESDFKKLLEAAVLWPVKLDWSFVDFDYSEETLKSNSFIPGADPSQELPMKKDEYSSLGLRLEKQTLANGDQLFRFIAPPNKILQQPEDYIFQFVRQNRPPALDYVERDYCEEKGYDYLAIEGDEELRGIDISLIAKDPDEDEEISYSFENVYGLINEAREENNFLVNAPLRGTYEIIARAIDYFGAQDEQKIRILVDRPLKTEVSLEMPYELYYQGEKKSYQDIFSENTYWVSPEDPVFVTVSWPEQSLTRDPPDKVALSYTDPSTGEGFNLELPDPWIITQSGGCFNLPWQENIPSHCQLSDYSKEEFENWKKGIFTFNPFKSLTREEAGKLRLDFEITYCEKNLQSDFSEADIVVKECVPHTNPEHPYPYLPNDPKEHYKWKFGLDENGKTDFNNFIGEEEINPFLATHSCCTFNWELFGPDHICFINPQPESGCFGFFDPSTKGSWLEERIQKANCDGQRGNLCGGELYPEYTSLNVCGDSDLYKTGEGRCNKVAAKCKNQKPFSYEPGENGFWCHGTFGCGLDKDVCKTEIVSKVGLGFEDININNYAQFRCGCAPATWGEAGDEGKDCLSLSSGREGVCTVSGYCAASQPI